MSEIVEFKKGEIISKQGDFDMVMYKIISGSVSVYLDYGEETEMFLKKQVPGQYFGQLELIEAIPRSATTVAAEDTKMEKILGEEFGDYFSTHEEEHMEVLTQMCARLREIGSQIHVVYQTIDEYLSKEEPDHDESFFSKLAKIITFGKSRKEEDKQ